MTGYYDYVLGLIPVSVVGISAVLLGVGLSFTVAVPVAMLAAIGLMGHAMFVNAPVDRASSPTQTAPQSQDTPRYSAD